MAKSKLPSFHGPTPMRYVVDDRLSGLMGRLLAHYAFSDRLSLTRGEGAGCYVSNASLAARLGCDYTTLIKLRKSLVELGYIQLEPRAGGKRLEVVRVIPDHLADPESWPFDQSYIGEGCLSAWGGGPDKTGEPTNFSDEEAGEPTNFEEPKVGDEISEPRGNPPKTDPQYIPLEEGETYSSEEGGRYSPEGAHVADRDMRHDEGHPENVVRFPDQNGAEREEPEPEHLVILEYCPENVRSLAFEAKLAIYERALTGAERDRRPVDRGELDAWASRFARLADQAENVSGPGGSHHLLRLEDLFTNYPYAIERTDHAATP